MAWNRFWRVVLPFLAPCDSSLLLRAALEVWWSKGVVPKSVGTFSRALGGVCDEYRRVQAGFRRVNLLMRGSLAFILFSLLLAVV